MWNDCAWAYAGWIAQLLQDNAEVSERGQIN